MSALLAAIYFHTCKSRRCKKVYEEKHKNQRYCSLKCRDDEDNSVKTDRRKKIRRCLGCNIQFVSTQRKRKWCQKRCYMNHYFKTYKRKSRAKNSQEIFSVTPG